MGHIVILQVSDPHMGENLLNAREARTHSGYNCHDISLCRSLDLAFEEDIREAAGIDADARVFVIMGGDLTSAGKHGEFAVARSYFQDSTYVDYDTLRDSVGLDLDINDLGMVPGNHDHWFGLWQYPAQRGY